ncbi:DUF4251 domain-containing protein [Aequorivita sp. SDUM287046]|uniref:DUF4251 domain-containing protein n=1 Tax=Aequorivita aurantiaca TaxID=3053356 RepID=A0ABT8DJZ1_9FLAO|nr:DUF4251 domain-containing protein [Aequorivita aurantiaca]MDN3723563.1 DUF4251 domain-containing protein [Aequorivita aurantiaca]
MKNPVFILLWLCLSIGNLGFAQEETKKQQKAERKAELNKEIAQLIDSREYAFVANTVLPLSLPPINLNPGSADVIFGPEMVTSNLPFFGVAYSGADLSHDQGMAFSGAPTNYKIKNRKKTYDIEMDIKTDNDSYSLSLSVGLDGNALLTISSTHRSDVSYSGNIARIRKE